MIETTPEHPFYTVDEGWVASGDLESGDQILSLTGDIGVVEFATFDTRDQVMYNLTVDSVHTFAVGDGAWVVHNTCHPVIDETLNNVGKGDITSEYIVDGLEIFDIAEEFLGPNYTVGKRDSFYSADNTRRVRMDPNWLAGKHRPWEPHFHLEIGSFLPNGTTWKPTINNHIIIIPR